MPACPAGHETAAGDYCDVCGAPLAGSPAAPLITAADETCPDCGALRTGRFCEECGFSFEAPAAASSAPGPPEAPASSAAAWTAEVSADRAYFDAVEADGGPDGAAVTFPPYCPPRIFALTGDQIRVGRRSVSRGTAPEIDLTGPPLDPGVSHLHLLLNRTPDDSWELVDPGSANGTRINDVSNRVMANEPVALADGDRIHIGAWTTITVRKGGGQ